MSDKFEMTQEGYNKAQEELQRLYAKRQDIVERIAEARSHGDLSENAEYDAARNAQAANEGEIFELEYKVKNAVIIAESTDDSVVHIGSVVTVHDEEFDEDATYTVLGTMEADINKGIISNQSPLGEALMGHRAGEMVTVKAPECDYKLTIKAIEKQQ